MGSFPFSFSEKERVIPEHPSLVFDQPNCALPGNVVKTLGNNEVCLSAGFHGDASEGRKSDRHRHHHSSLR